MYDRDVRVGVVVSLVLALVGGCGFQHGRLPGDGGGGGGDDGPSGDALDGAIDAMEPPLCDPNDPNLRACYDFDGNALDETANHNDATLTGMSFVPGRRGMALHTSTGTAVVGSSTSLDVSMLSIKMWIKPNSLPTGTARMGLLDSGGRYRLFIVADGALRCAITGGATLVTAVGKVATGQWQRVTCTYDGLHMRAYVDGVLAGMLDQASTIPQTGGGMVIGHNNPDLENFDGAIDQLQLFATVVTP